MGELDVYTRSWQLDNFKNPLPILLYNSTKVVYSVAKNYQKFFSTAQLSSGVIVAYAELVQWRALTETEIISFLMRFNGFKKEEALKLYRESVPGQPSKYIWPCEYGLFFRNVIRLANPIPFIPDGQKSFYQLPLADVALELKKSGLKISEVTKLLKVYQ